MDDVCGEDLDSKESNNLTGETLCGYTSTNDRESDKTNPVEK